MQILHPTTGGLYTGLTNAFSTIYRIEGWRTLWKGVSSVIVGAGPAHAVYFGTYELVKELAGGNVDQGHHPLAAGEFGYLCLCNTITDCLKPPVARPRLSLATH